MESVEFLQEGSSSLLAEGLQEDEVLAMLQGCELDVLDRLEEGRHLARDLALLLGFVADSVHNYL